MDRIACKECGKPMGIRAKRCMGCGAPVKHYSAATYWMVVLCWLSLAALFALYSLTA
ncbi:MAG: hypothetical protein U1F68_02660 [Gammaproteobacteria bacterium]